MPRHNRFGISRIQITESFRRKILIFTPNEKKMTIAAYNEDPHNDYDSQTIIFEISQQRAIKLAEEILSYYDRKHQEDIFKPDWNDIEKALIERYGICNWMTDFARKLDRTSPEQIKDFIRGYQWLKDNEKWLYERIENKTQQNKEETL
jgi:hypothetical protein